LLAKDGKVAWCINAAVVLGTVFVMMAGISTVMADKVIVGVGSYNGDMGCGGGCWGCRAFTIMCGTIRRGRSRCTCNTCLMGRSGGVSPLGSMKLMGRFVECWS